MTAQAIETHYADCRFRSRLEARWAVFFNTLGIKWEYEPQGYTVGPSSRPYLPDFRLPELNTFVEVKGDAERLDVNLLAEFTRERRDAVFTLVLGPVPNMETGKIPTHALFMPSFDFSEYAGGNAHPSTSVTNDAFAALDRLDKNERAAVNELITFHRRMGIACYQSFFVGARHGWALIPFGMPNTICTPEMILTPPTVWPLIPQPRVKQAYQAARSARFEHGEKG